FVVVHAANNSFSNWLEYNRMIGLGGWGGRTEKHGPYLYFSDQGKLVRDPRPGRGGSHGPQHEFLVKLRKKEHPIVKGMPATWKHAKDELYDSLRGPAEKVEVLATAYSAKSKKHEPMIMTISYGEGRVFHTPMGHADYSMRCAGFYDVLRRGTEWAATGKVTLPLSKNFPTADKVVSVPKK
ncbi:MAG: ThuA domain-containing protein, partial [Opitutales bacterium]